MGCCLSRKEKNNVQELSTTTNAAIACKCGLKGENIRVVHDSTSNSFNISGSGTVLGSCPLDCDCARWEILMGDGNGEIQVGVKRFDRKFPSSLEGNLKISEGDPQSQTHFLSDVTTNPGDVVGVFWDQTDLPMLSFTLNGQRLFNASINRVRPSTDVYPAVSVSGTASCTLIFDENYFKYPAPSSKFKMILCSTSLI